MGTPCWKAARVFPVEHLEVVLVICQAIVVETLVGPQ